MRLFLTVIFAIATLFVITVVNAVVFVVRLLFAGRRQVPDTGAADEAEPVGMLDDVTVIRDAEYEEVR